MVGASIPRNFANRSQIDSPLPSSNAAPSICAAAVATPQAKFLGNAYGRRDRFPFARAKPRTGGLATWLGLIIGGIVPSPLQRGPGGGFPSIAVISIHGWSATNKDCHRVVNTGIVVTVPQPSLVSVALPA